MNGSRNSIFTYSPDRWTWPYLRGRRVVLRRPEASDLMGIHNALDTPGVREFFRFPKGVTLDYADRYLHNFLYLQFTSGQGMYPLICDRRDGKTVLGVVGLSDFDDENNGADLGIWLRSDQWGRGLGQEAARLMFSLGFGQLGLERIQALVEADNKHSLGMFLALGATQEGVLRNRVRFGAEYRDAIVVSILRGEWDCVRHCTASSLAKEKTSTQASS